MLSLNSIYLSGTRLFCWSSWIVHRTMAMPLPCSCTFAMDVPWLQRTVTDLLNDRLRLQQQVHENKTSADYFKSRCRVLQTTLSDMQTKLAESVKRMEAATAEADAAKTRIEQQTRENKTSEEYFKSKRLVLQTMRVSQWYKKKAKEFELKAANYHVQVFHP